MYIFMICLFADIHNSLSSDKCNSLLIFNCLYIALLIILKTRSILIIMKMKEVTPLVMLYKTCMEENTNSRIHNTLPVIV